MPSDAERPSTSLWLQDLQPLDHATVPASTTVAVIGAGIAGISVAVHLARRGIDVTVLDAGRVAGRASGRNDGQLLLGLGEHYNRIHGQFGAERAPLLWDFLGQNHEALLRELDSLGIACDLEHRGGLRLAETEHEQSELEQAAALLRSESKPHELLSRSDVEQRLPAGRGFCGGLFLADEAIVQPARMVRGLARAAADAGARVCEGARVTAVAGEPGGFVVTLANGQRLDAAVVVHCTSSLARSLDTTGLLERAVFPFRGQIVATDPLPDAVVSQFPPYAMSSNFCYEYFRMHRGRFVLGGKRWSVPGEELRITDDSSHNPAVSENLLAYAHEHFPVLHGVPFPHVWTGIMAGTPDGLPLCGALPGQPGVFALLGFNGYGLSFAFLAGQALAEMIVDGRGQHPALSLFAPRRLHEA